MKKIPDFIVKRLYENVFICKNCKKKIRANPAKVRAGKVKCPRCGSKNLRLKRKESRKK